MLQLHVWISFYLNKSQKFFPLRTLRLISRNNVCSETLSNRTKEKEITNSPLRVVDADIFSTNDSADRIYANIHAWVSAVCNARGSPEICLSHPRYTLDVTSPRTIRKNMNRRESYEGEGISNSPTMWSYVHVYASGTISQCCGNPSALRQVWSSFPWNACALYSKNDYDTHTPPSHAHTFARRICIERFVENV